MRGEAARVLLMACIVAFIAALIILGFPWLLTN